jgi:hypothetical protein
MSEPWPASIPLATRTVCTNWVSPTFEDIS